MKRLPWISGLTLAVVMYLALTLIRTVNAAVGPCITHCGNAQYWTEQYCYSIGCSPTPGAWSCGTNGSGIGGYSRGCQCTCGGNNCQDGIGGTINPSCTNPPLP
jgi:hypothetical protein